MTHDQTKFWNTYFLMLEDANWYQHLTKKLIYMEVTHPNIVYAGY